jgi:DNA-binding CsgD family transcriptional regulator
MLGQHTDEILRQMGLSPETIEGLRREDVVS